MAVVCDSPAPPRRRPRAWLLALLAVVAVVGAVAMSGPMRGRDRSSPAATPPDPEPKRHDVVVRKPVGPPVFHTGIKDAAGKPVTMACADCHKAKEPNPVSRLGGKMEFFHQTLKGQHGNLTCMSCHNPADAYATLRLADGKSLPFTEVMQLCAQCHGPQYRDYLHGAHGGMTGHWDLTRGGRTRANCVDCHNPHAPKYPAVQPAKGPNDRGAGKGTGHE